MRFVLPPSASPEIATAEAIFLALLPSRFLPLLPMIRPSSPVGIATVTENLLKRKWSATILRYLAGGIAVPAEISKREPELTVAVMNERLRTLLRYALVTRTRRPAPAKDTEYHLTPRGQKLLQMLNIIDRLDQQPANYELTIEEHLVPEAAESPTKDLAPQEMKRPPNDPV